VIQPYREHRPWGRFTQYVKNQPCTVKLLHLRPAQRLSLQVHEHRDEFWVILQGYGRAEVGTDEFWVHSADHPEVWIPRDTVHRLTASELETGLTFLEIAVGEFDEDDQTRLEDDYGRVDSG